MSSFEERIELGSDMVFEAAAPFANHKTGEIDKASAWPKLDATVCALRALGFPWREISQSYSLGLNTVREMVKLQRDIAAREQYGG